MKLIGLRKDKETEEIIRYELRIKNSDISTFYKDRYGVYVCTEFGRMYKVDYTIEELEEYVDIND